MVSVELALKETKSRRVGSPLPVKSADDISCRSVAEADDSLMQDTSELGTSLTAADTKTPESRSRLSEIDSGILMEEVDSDSEVVLAPRSKTSSWGVALKQESSPDARTRAESSSDKTSAPAQSAERKRNSSHKHVSFSTQGNVESLYKKLPKLSPRSRKRRSHSLLSTGQHKLGISAADVDEAHVAEVSGTENCSKSTTKKTRLGDAEKKCVGKKISRHQKFTGDSSRRRIVSSINTYINDDAIDDDDEPSPASQHLPLTSSHMDAGIGVFYYICSGIFFVINFL